MRDSIPYSTPAETAPPQATAESQPSSSAPDWSSLKEDLLCPLCEYNLHGLTEPRCPECGYTFTWDEILDPRRRRHPYIFEHALLNRSRSFIRTARAAWRPRRFWTKLHPAQPSAPRRIVHYWLIGAGLYLAGLAVLISATALVFISEQNRARAEFIADIKTGAGNLPRVIRDYGSVEAYVDSFQPEFGLNEAIRYSSWYGADAESLIIYGLFPTAWPWLTIASLMIFRISMRRAKIANAHVLRCVLYSFDLLFWIGALTIGLSVASMLIAGSLPRQSAHVFLIGLALLLLLFLPVAVYRLWWAYRLYLRFDHAFGTVFASQLIVFLAIFNVLMLLTLW
jgi:hypothetical protein